MFSEVAQMESKLYVKISVEQKMRVAASSWILRFEKLCIAQLILPENSNFLNYESLSESQYMLWMSSYVKAVKGLCEVKMLANTNSEQLH